MLRPLETVIRAGRRRAELLREEIQPDGLKERRRPGWIDPTYGTAYSSTAAWLSSSPKPGFSGSGSRPFLATGGRS